MRNSERTSWQDISACSPEVKCYWSQWNCLVLKDDLLYRTFENDDGTESKIRLIVLKSKVSEVLRQLHNSASGGHFGITKTLPKVREWFYWQTVKMM
ncbi:unnamed protein product [Diabrotica balteata]|uniref:Integrase zinc-binding domain-containing protein n=1 Tax=Diabrotica balteata TaxID=107213 RepID=A0A9N9SQT6_DIABA|nr:unnamed protein product [Diabrotica balteata]